MPVTRCQGCIHLDRNRCKVNICAAVRCLLIADHFPVPAEPAVIPARVEAPKAGACAHCSGGSGV